MRLSTIDITGFNEIEAAFNKAPEIVREEMMAAITEADVLLEREVEELMWHNKATGNSIASITRMEQELPYGAIGVVGTTQPHVVYVELGTRPHKVSADGVQALEDWARAKFSVNAKEANRIANAVAWKIRHHGTPAVGMFKRTFSQQRSAVIGIFVKARNRIAERIAGK